MKIPLIMSKTSWSSISQHSITQTPSHPHFLQKKKNFHPHPSDDFPTLLQPFRRYFVCPRANFKSIFAPIRQDSEATGERSTSSIGVRVTTSFFRRVLGRDVRVEWQDKREAGTRPRPLSKKMYFHEYYQTFPSHRWLYRKTYSPTRIDKSKHHLLKRKWWSLDCELVVKNSDYGRDRFTTINYHSLWKMCTWTF